MKMSEPAVEYAESLMFKRPKIKSVQNHVISRANQLKMKEDDFDLSLLPSPSMSKEINKKLILGKPNFTVTPKLRQIGSMIETKKTGIKFPSIVPLQGSVIDIDTKSNTNINLPSIGKNHRQLLRKDKNKKSIIFQKFLELTETEMMKDGAESVNSKRNNYLEKVLDIFKDKNTGMTKNGFEPETWERLSGKLLHEKKSLSKRSSTNEEHINANMPMLQRLSISLNHPHPGELRQIFQELDQKARSVRELVSQSEFVRLISKTPQLYSRSEKQLLQIDDFLRVLPAFKSLPDYTFPQICKKILSESLKRGQLLFKQHEPGAKWYVILTGRVKLLYDPDDSKTQNVIAVLGEGESFGESSLINNEPRTCYAMVDSKSCVLLTLSKQVYLEYMLPLAKLETHSRVSVVKKLPLFKALEFTSLREISNKTVIRKFEANSVIIREGDINYSVFFVKSGKCAIFRSLELKEGSKIIQKNVLLGYLGPNTSFNEESIFSNGISNRRPAPYSVITVSDSEIGSVIAKKEWANYGLCYEPSIYAEMTQKQLLHRYRISCEVDKFRKYQERYVTALLSESKEVKHHKQTRYQL